MLVAMAVHDTVENERAWMTRATLKSLAQTVEWGRHRLFVVDNGSCRETEDYLSRSAVHFPFTLIRNAENVGTAKAINQAWFHRQPGEHAVKMDNDVVVRQSGWVDWMEDVFERDTEIGICGLKRKDLLESPVAQDDWKSTLRMLPHELGQRWLVVEEVQGVIGTCEAFSSALLDKIGYLSQPGVYGFDDSLASIRANLAGFKRVFLHGFDIDHIDPGGDAYCAWKVAQANAQWAAFNTEVIMLKSGVHDIYYDGGFSGV